MKNIILFCFFIIPVLLYSYCKENVFSYEQYLECYTSKTQCNNIVSHNLYKKIDIYDNFKIIKMNDNNKLNFKNEIGVKFNISRNNIIMIGIDNKK